MADAPLAVVTTTDSPRAAAVAAACCRMAVLPSPASPSTRIRPPRIPAAREETASSMAMISDSRPSRTCAIVLGNYVSRKVDWPGRRRNGLSSKAVVLPTPSYGIPCYVTPSLADSGTP
eukprot:scaffold64749_cov28-Tisochrysis_lutea.AAC.7